MSDPVRESEGRWLVPLYSHCKGLFSKVFIPSHDHFHHHRVWEFTKSILYALHDSGHPVSPELIDQLIIAVFFHDTGLTLTPDEKHGKKSRKLCEAYFREHKWPAPPELDAILHAIEHHDDKSFHTVGGNRIEPGLLQILTGADDLDALGRIGIYRYAEIYLLRDVSREELPLSVLSNVGNRYANFRNSFLMINAFTDRQVERYKIIEDFFRDLAGKMADQSTYGSWEQGLLDHISQGLQDGINLMSPGRKLPVTFRAEIETFFNELDREIEGFNPPGELLI